MAQPPRRRTVLLLISVLAVLAAVALIVFVLRLSRQPGAKVNIGGTEFTLGRDDAFAARVTRSGPLILAPLRGGLTIYVQHLGADPARGWLAFSAFAPPDSGHCIVRWRPAHHDFAGCRGATYPEDGRGLEQYSTRVDRSGEVVINLRQGVGTTPPASTP